ncbi:hypothetical protein CTA2_11686 [Colletotrichum tanaceti]|uniref:Uncharacterized protein n=1 Tax=Colletotrichum tanaceti TaxID=1306861 RepID=A0A4U6WZ37_9PEZI|nr:hypothetical protein CTA2_11686 [Colletotrichum tanaceti]TKW48398.1 hypothetical protein CTA1_7980 [Colletotrichum tanaceti]
MPRSNLPVISGHDCGISRRAIVEAHSVAKAQPPGYGDWIELFPSFAHLEASALQPVPHHSAGNCL